MRVLLLIPPMTQLNTPYPSTAFLKGFLDRQGVTVFQADPALELVLTLFSKQGLRRVLKELQVQAKSTRFFVENQERYLSVVDDVIRFLQGKDPALAHRIVRRDFLPEGPRFLALREGVAAEDPDPVSWAFGSLGIQDRAKYLASLLIDDLADVIREGIDPRFELSRYAEKLAGSAPSFDPMEQALNASPTLVDQILDELTMRLLREYAPDVVGLSVPFPGNVYGALRMGKLIKGESPSTSVVLGGGYVNTELRTLTESRIFDSVDFITLDDGEQPFLRILEHLQGKRTEKELFRTFVRRSGVVVYQSDSTAHDVAHKDKGTPSYKGLPLERYLSLFEMLNPMHRIWSDGRWNKLMLAHGCYWKKCSFCDISLDYIGRYDPASAKHLADQMEAIANETGQSGFHFVDEAAPPAILKALSQELIQRKLNFTWWGNIRFDRTFTQELAELMAKAGCVAVSGGLEVASDRLLVRMQKGVTVEQVARVTHHLTEAGIMVHAYLMYGFPTQTVQETVDALDRVRQLFQWGCIQSAYWHRFSVTAHSPIGLEPEKFGIRVLSPPTASFARNDLEFEDPTKCDHDWLGEGLRKALYNYMHGVGFDQDVRKWFNVGRTYPKVPRSSVSPHLIEQALA